MNMDAFLSLQYFDQGVIPRIMQKYDMGEMDAARAFLTSETHAMLEDRELGMSDFSELAVFDMWENERVTGDPRTSVHLRSELS